MLFALTNLAASWGSTPSRRCATPTDRFGRRFRHIEETLAAQGRAVADASADEQDRLWEAAKRIERG